LYGLGDFLLDFRCHLLTGHTAADLSKRFTGASQKLLPEHFLDGIGGQKPCLRRLLGKVVWERKLNRCHG